MPKPADEYFMSVEQEAEVENLKSAVSAEETWWNFFQLLIPGMQECELALAKLEYWPAPCK